MQENRCNDHQTADDNLREKHCPPLAGVGLRVLLPGLATVTFEALPERKCNADIGDGEQHLDNPVEQFGLGVIFLQRSISVKQMSIVCWSSVAS